MRRVAYLSLQATRPGQASYAHVHEIIKGLAVRNWSVTLFEPSHSSSGLLGRAMGFLWAQIRMWLNGRPDVVYIRWHAASWPSAMLARVLRVPVVQEVNGPYDDLFIAWPGTRRFAKFFVWLMRSQLRSATAVITVTSQLADWVRRESGNKDTRIWVIPNGANTDLFHPDARHRRRPALGDKYIIFVGALARWQGVDTMLAATEHPDWPADVTLVIVGDGVERAKVEGFAEKSSRVRYLGQQPYDVVPALVAGSIAGLSPQVGHRGNTGLFPLKVFEYLACGVPAIVSDYPGMAELVRQGRCGLVVPAGSAGALARAVQYLAANVPEAQEMGRRGRKLVEREHSWDKRAEETALVLDGIVTCSERH